MVILDLDGWGADVAGGGVLGVVRGADDVASGVVEGTVGVGAMIFVGISACCAC